MFPEFRDLITQLKTEDAHFARLFEQHNDLDQRIKNIETHKEKKGTKKRKKRKAKKRKTAFER